MRVRVSRSAALVLPLGFLFCLNSCSTARAEDEIVELRRVPFDPEKRMVIPVELFGEERLFEIGWGTPVMFVDNKFKDRLMPFPRAVEIGLNSGTPGLTTAFQSPEIHIGGHGHQSKLPTICIDMSGFTGIHLLKLDGMLGIDFLNSIVLRVNFDERFIAAQSRPTLLPAYQEQIYRTKAGVNQILVQVSSAGFKPFQLYYGGYDVGLEHRLFDELQRRKRIVPIAVKRSSNITTRYGILDRLTLGPYHFHNVPVVTGDNNFLTESVLQRFDIEFDFPNRRSYFRPGKLFNSPFLHNVAGLNVQRLNGKTTVTELRDGGLADKSDVQIGDMITQLNGKPIAEFSVSTILALFRQPGTELQLFLDRDGQRLDRRLQLAHPEDPEPFPAEDPTPTVDFDDEVLTERK